MQELRAYLIIRFAVNDWDVSVHRNFETIIDKWQSFNKIKGKTAVLHVGFWRPATNDFERVSLKFPDRVLVTASSRFSLPPTCQVSNEEVGRIQDLPIYLVLSGWGYEISEKSFLNSKSINNKLHEAEKSKNIFYDICGEIPSENNILRYLKFTPKWFLELPISSLDLSVRSQKYFNKISVKHITDLVKIGERGLYGNKNFGFKSIAEIPHKLFKLLNNYQKPESEIKTPISINDNCFDTFLNSLHFVLSQLTSNQNKVLMLRMGLSSNKAMKLREVGAELNYSPEGIRRIEIQGISEIINILPWKKTLQLHLDNLFTGRTEPLLFAGMEFLDPWFKGISERETTFKYILDAFFKNHLSIIRQDTQVFVSKLNQDQWDKIIETGINMLESEIQNSISEEKAKLLVNSLLVGKGEELQSELWRVITRSAHFAESQNGGKYLLSFGLGAEHKVESILMESATPLHFTEIANRVRMKYHDTLEIRRIHWAAKNVGFLFGRGTYGLIKHFPLSDPECELLISEIDDFIDDSEIDKQWHCSEICEALQERNVEYNFKLTPYIINIVLSRSQSYINLKRMIWAKRTDNINNKKRIEINQAIIAILKNAGKPLSRNDIRKILVSSRGLGDIYQFQAEGSLIRVGKNLWGIKERDLPFTEDEIEKLSKTILIELVKNQKGIHVTEIKSLFQDSLICKKISDNQILVLSIIKIKLKMKVDQGQYIYLSDWKNSRRLSIREAAFKVFATSPTDGLSLDEIHKKIELLIERSIEKSKVSAAISNIEAIYDEKTKQWALPLDDDEIDIQQSKIE